MAVVRRAVVPGGIAPVGCSAGAGNVDAGLADATARLEAQTTARADAVRERDALVERLAGANETIASLEAARVSAGTRLAELENAAADAARDRYCPTLAAE